MKHSLSAANFNKHCLPKNVQAQSLQDKLALAIDVI